MLLRVMTVATVLMLLACLMIGATLALAQSSRTQDKDTAAGSIRQPVSAIPRDKLLPTARDSLSASISHRFHHQGIRIAPHIGGGGPFPARRLAEEIAIALGKMRG